MMRIGVYLPIKEEVVLLLSDLRKSRITILRQLRPAIFSIPFKRDMKTVKIHFRNA